MKEEDVEALTKDEVTRELARLVGQAQSELLQFVVSALHYQRVELTGLASGMRESQESWHLKSMATACDLIARWLSDEQDAVDAHVASAEGFVMDYPERSALELWNETRGLGSR